MLIEGLVASSPSIVNVGVLERVYDYFLASIALYGGMILVQAIAANLSNATTPKSLFGPRDDLPVEGVSNFHGRSKRAQANMTESMIMFVPLMIIALQKGLPVGHIEFAAMLFFYSRLAYAPLYYLGVPVLRTVAWFGGIVAIGFLFFEVWI